MKNYVLIGPWRVVAMGEIMLVLDILKEANLAQEAFNQTSEPVWIN